MYEPEITQVSDLHIDDFYQDVGKILRRLYSAFPNKTDLYVDDISGADEPDEVGLHHPRYLSCYATMVWLAEHDYLTFGATMRQDGLDQATLTRKSFLILSGRSRADFATPPAGSDLPDSLVEQSLTNISQLRAALKSGSSIRVEQCVRYLLSLPEGHWN
jgi:hypothetical protein